MSGINQVLEDVVTQAAVIEQVASDDITCSRDYSVSCPEGCRHFAISELALH